MNPTLFHTCQKPLGTFPLPRLTRRMQIYPTTKRTIPTLSLTLPTASSSLLKPHPMCGNVPPFKSYPIFPIPMHGNLPPVKSYPIFPIPMRGNVRPVLATPPPLLLPTSLLVSGFISRSLPASPAKGKISNHPRIQTAKALRRDGIRARQQQQKQQQ